MTIEENYDLKELSVQTEDLILYFHLYQDFVSVSKHLCLNFCN